MNFDFTEEQVMLRDSVARYVQDEYDFDTRRGIANSEEGMDRQRWQTFAELGWLSIPFAEEHGGLLSVVRKLRDFDEASAGESG